MTGISRFSSSPSNQHQQSHPLEQKGANGTSHTKPPSKVGQSTQPKVPSHLNPSTILKQNSPGVQSSIGSQHKVNPTIGSNTLGAGKVKQALKSTEIAPKNYIVGNRISKDDIKVNLDSYINREEMFSTLLTRCKTEANSKGVNFYLYAMKLDDYEASIITDFILDSPNFMFCTFPSPKKEDSGKQKQILEQDKKTFYKSIEMKGFDSFESIKEEFIELGEVTIWSCPKRVIKDEKKDALLPKDCVSIENKIITVYCCPKRALQYWLQVDPTRTIKYNDNQQIQINQIDKLVKVEDMDSFHKIMDPLILKNRNKSN